MNNNRKLTTKSCQHQNQIAHKALLRINSKPHLYHHHIPLSYHNGTMLHASFPPIPSFTISAAYPNEERSPYRADKRSCSRTTPDVALARIDSTTGVGGGGAGWPVGDIRPPAPDEEVIRYGETVSEGSYSTRRGDGVRGIEPSAGLAL
jgi:hypothetical protein